MSEGPNDVKLSQSSEENLPGSSSSQTGASQIAPDRSAHSSAAAESEQPTRPNKDLVSRKQGTGALFQRITGALRRSAGPEEKRTAENAAASAAASFRKDRSSSAVFVPVTGGGTEEPEMTEAEAKPLSGELPASAAARMTEGPEMSASDDDWGWLRERVMKSTAEPTANESVQEWVPPILFDATDEEALQAAAAALPDEGTASATEPTSTEAPQADTGPLRDFIAGLLRISDDKKSPLEEGEVTDDLVAERLNRSLGMLPPDEMTALSTAGAENEKDSTGYVAPFSDWLGDPPSDSQPFPRVVGEDFIEPEEPEIAQFEQFLNWTPENTLQEEKRLDLPLDEAVFQTSPLRMPFEDLPKTAQLSQEQSPASASFESLSSQPGGPSAEQPVSDPVSDIREIALQGYREEEKNEPPSVQLSHIAKKPGKNKRNQNAYPTAKASVNWQTWLSQRSGIEKLLLVEGLLVILALVFAIPFFVYMVVRGLM